MYKIQSLYKDQFRRKGDRMNKYSLEFSREYMWHKEYYNQFHPQVSRWNRSVIYDHKECAIRFDINR